MIKMGCNFLLRIGGVVQQVEMPGRHSFEGDAAPVDRIRDAFLASRRWRLAFRESSLQAAVIMEGSGVLSGMREDGSPVLMLLPGDYRVTYIEWIHYNEAPADPRDRLQLEVVRVNSPLQETPVTLADIVRGLELRWPGDQLDFDSRVAYEIKALTENYNHRHDPPSEARANRMAEAILAVLCLPHFAEILATGQSNNEDDARAAAYLLRYYSLTDDQSMWLLHYMTNAHLTPMPFTPQQASRAGLRRALNPLVERRWPRIREQHLQDAEFWANRSTFHIDMGANSPFTHYTPEQLRGFWNLPPDIWPTGRPSVDPGSVDNSAGFTIRHMPMSPNEVSNVFQTLQGERGIFNDDEFRRMFLQGDFPPNDSSLPTSTAAPSEAHLDLERFNEAVRRLGLNRHAPSADDQILDNLRGGRARDPNHPTNQPRQDAFAEAHLDLERFNEAVPRLGLNRHAPSADDQILDNLRGGRARDPNHPTNQPRQDAFAEDIEGLNMEGVEFENGEIVADTFASLPQRVLAEFPDAQIEEREDDLLASLVGWWVHFANGYAVSIAFGPGTRSTNEHLYDLNSYHLPPEMVEPSSEQPLPELTRTAEVQAVDQQRHWWHKQPLEYQSLEDTLSFIRQVAKAAGKNNHE